MGIPSDSRNGSAFVCYSEIAMSAHSKSKDAVWEFMREFLSDDYQNNLNYYFPVLNSAIDALAELCMTPPETDEYGNVVWEEEE